MARGVDPKRMNWLWRLICELGSIDASEVVESLHAAGVAVDLRRVKSWTVSDREASFFPMTLAEMERNVRTVLALRIARAEATQEKEPAAGAGEAAADQAAPNQASPDSATADEATSAIAADGEAAPLEW